LAIGKLTKSGTSVIAGLINGVSNLGTLMEIQDIAPAMDPLAAVDSAPGSEASSSSSEGQPTAGTSGGTSDATGSVFSVLPPVTFTSINAVGGAIRLTFSGAPNQTYQIHRAPTLQRGASGWTSIGSAITDAAGQGQFTDNNPPPAQGYYRTASH
jgi:hypothetical protein